MYQRQRWMGWLAAVGLAVVMLVVAGCGGSGTITTTAVPAKPAGVAATAGSAQVSLSWPAVSGATSYNIYYGTSAGVTTASGTKIANASTPQTVTGLTDGTPYYFVITALNADGESAASSEVSATPLAKPTGIVVSGGDAQATVSWASVTGATAYNIYYGTAAGVTAVNGTKIAGVTSPQVVTGLTNGTAYYFVVSAANAGGESSVSSEKSATPAVAPQPPGNPTGVTATAGAGQVTVTWTAVPTATSYYVYYLQSAATPTTATVLATGTKVASLGSPLVVTGLASGASYWITVTAVNAGGESGGQTSPKKAVVL